jgi:hypothetical protein
LEQERGRLGDRDYEGQKGRSRRWLGHRDGWTRRIGLGLEGMVEASWARETVRRI